MDGFNSNENIIVFGATNWKDILDPALTRPGWLDRIIDIELPDLKGRADLFGIYLKRIKLQTNDNDFLAW